MNSYTLRNTGTIAIAWFGSSPNSAPQTKPTKPIKAWARWSTVTPVKTLKTKSIKKNGATEKLKHWRVKYSLEAK